MTSTAVFLILASVVIHVGWNLIVKREDPSAAFFFVACALGVLLLLPLLLWYGPRLDEVPLAVWRIVVGAGLFQAIYYVGLAGAYRSGDLSIAYPLARSLPPVLVVLASLLLGRADRISTQCLIGIALVFAGGLLLPLAHFRDLRPARYRDLGLALAVLAAAGTAGYSLLDDTGLRLLRELAETPFAPIEAALVYAPLEALSSSFFLGLWVLARRSERSVLVRVASRSLLPALGVGISIYLAYGLVLISMAYVSDVSYVVAFRQLSVPLGALVGVWLLRERRSIPKALGVALAFVGVLLVGAG